MTKKLNKEDWIAHGFVVLKTDGHEALKADKMVKTLGVSRGSFYWHFESISSFHDALLMAWRKQITEVVIQELKRMQGESNQLRDLIYRVLSVEQGLEAAIRRWAGSDANAAKMVNEVDALRTRYAQHLFLQSGISEEGAAARAQFLNWAYVGMAINTSIGQTSKPEWANLFADMMIRLDLVDAGR